MTNPNNYRILTLLFFSSVFCIKQSIAQTQYRQSGDSYITISGTSTLNAWTMTSEGGEFLANFDLNTDGTPQKLNSLSVSIPSKSLKSGHGAMDKNAYSALDADVHKTIDFRLSSATIKSQTIYCVGNLTVAGVTKLISVEVSCQKLPKQLLLFTGSKEFKMSEFNVEAPEFMFGTVKTADEITISFNITLIPKK